MLKRKQVTVVDVTDLEPQVKEWARNAYCERVNGNESFMRIYPEEILDSGYDLNEGIPIHERRVISLEEFKEVYDNEDEYNFLKYCVENGQREEFILLYWW